MGPQGLGAYSSPTPWQSGSHLSLGGGTGSLFDLESMPGFLPTGLKRALNLPGTGLAALDWGVAQGGRTCAGGGKRLTGHLIARMREMEEDGLRVLGTLDGTPGGCGIGGFSGPGQCRGRLPPGKGVRHTGPVRPSLCPAGP